MRYLVAFSLLFAGCSKPGDRSNPGLRLESAVPAALATELGLADSIYLTTCKASGTESENRVTQELRHPGGNRAALEVGDLYPLGSSDPNTRRPEQWLVLRYSPGRPAGNDGGFINEECYPIYGGVLYYEQSHVPAELVTGWLARNPVAARPSAAAVCDPEATVILAVMDAATAAPTGGHNPELLRGALEGDPTKGTKQWLLVAGDGPVIPTFRGQLTADESLSKAKCVLMLNCQRRGAATALTQVKRIRLLAEEPAPNQDGQLAMVETIDGTPTLTFRLEQDSTLWKYAKAGTSVDLAVPAKK